MAEHKTKLQAVEVEYVCDHCGVGKMLPINSGVRTWGGAINVTHPHRCSHCDKLASLDFIYPRIVYEKIEVLNGICESATNG